MKLGTVVIIAHNYHVKMLNYKNPRWRTATIWKPLNRNISAVGWPITGKYLYIAWWWHWPNELFLCRPYTTFTILRNKTTKAIKTKNGFGFLGRLFRVYVIKPVCLSVLAYICTYVRPFVCPSTKSFFDFNDIWYVGRGWWVMHDGVHCDQIQGHDRGYKPFKVGNRPFSKAISSAI